MLVLLKSLWIHLKKNKLVVDLPKDSVRRLLNESFGKRSEVCTVEHCKHAIFGLLRYFFLFDLITYGWMLAVNTRSGDLVHLYAYKLLQGRGTEIASTGRYNWTTSWSACLSVSTFSTVCSKIFFLVIFIKKRNFQILRLTTITIDTIHDSHLCAITQTVLIFHLSPIIITKIQK